MPHKQRNHWLSVVLVNVIILILMHFILAGPHSGHDHVGDRGADRTLCGRAIHHRHGRLSSEERTEAISKKRVPMTADTPFYASIGTADYTPITGPAARPAQ